MPYVKSNIARELDQGATPSNAGELNYAITKLVCRFLLMQPKLNYQAFNDAMGAIEGAKLELYRHSIAGYEDNKIHENGDVYPKELGGYN